MTNQEFTNEVLSYKGKYSEKELKKFIKYYLQPKKHFSTFEKFNISRRLATWFSPKRNQKFKEKISTTPKDELQLTFNILGFKAKIIKDV